MKTKEERLNKLWKKYAKLDDEVTRKADKEYMKVYLELFKEYQKKKKEIQNEKTNI